MFKKVLRIFIFLHPLFIIKKMSFLNKNTEYLINIKLTNTGRKHLASGSLTFDKAVVSDREIDYGYNRRYPANFNLNPAPEKKLNFSDKKILSPKDDHPFLSPFQFDGTEPFDLTSFVHSNKKTATKEVSSLGFWTSLSSGTKEKIGEYILNETIANGKKTYESFTGSNHLNLTSTIVEGESLEVGDLVYIRNIAAVNSGNQLPLSATAQNYAFTNFWYRTSSATTSDFKLDRPTVFHAPSLTGATDFDRLLYHYNYDSIRTKYGTSINTECPVWNLNIVRTSREIGMSKKAVGSNKAQSYTNYASSEFAGTKRLFGFQYDIRQVGFIHYTNEYVFEKYGQRLVPGETEVDFPDLLWHRIKDDNGYLYLSGNCVFAGHRFTDYQSEVFFDEISQSHYTLLKDHPENGITVGRVYFDLQLIVITDPELLTAITYKSNRNWTLPPLSVQAISNPKPPFNTNTKPGFLRSGYNYYVTYLIDVGDADENYKMGENFGLQQTFVCQYIKKLSGQTDDNGNHMHLWAQFPTGQLPYMRTTSQFESLSGTGWGANKVQILVQEVEQSKDLGIDVVHPAMWSGCSSLSGNTVINDPAGVYKHSNDDLSINQTDLVSAEFIVSKLDIETGNTYSKLESGLDNNFYSIPNELVGNLNHKETGLSLGSESHFFGNIKTKASSDVFESFITLFFEQNEIVNTESPTYNQELNENTYVTEIGVLNENNELVAVGKVNNPISRTELNSMALQLKIDF